MSLGLPLPPILRTWALLPALSFLQVPSRIAIPFQSTPLATVQFFVTKVNTGNSGKSSIAYSTYFGGANSRDDPAGCRRRRHRRGYERQYLF